MKNKAILLAVLAIALVLGMTACSDDSGPNTDPKTLVITGYPKVNEEYIWHGNTYVFPQGKVPQGSDAVAINTGKNLVFQYDRTKGTVTINLYLPDESKPWTGNGTYDVYSWLGLTEQSSTKFYKATVTFSSATTTVPFSSFVVVTP